MKNKKIKYKDLCQIVQEQKDQIQELKQTIKYIQNNYFCNIPFQAEVAYDNLDFYCKKLRISYLENDKVNTVTYTLRNDFLSLPKIKKIIKQSDVIYIVVLQNNKNYYEYYGVDTSAWTIFDATSLVKSNEQLKGTIKTQTFVS